MNYQFGCKILVNGEIDNPIKLYFYYNSDFQYKYIPYCCLNLIFVVLVLIICGDLMHKNTVEQIKIREHKKIMKIFSYQLN